MSIATRSVGAQLDWPRPDKFDDGRGPNCAAIRYEPAPGDPGAVLGVIGFATMRER
jgi:single-stranded DNA-specific DHH superfamily exonuclease